MSAPGHSRRFERASGTSAVPSTAEAYAAHHGAAVVQGETVCAENNLDYFNQGLFPVPEADKPDFWPAQ